MPAAQLDLQDRLALFPIAYGYQPVKGWRVQHVDESVFDATLNQTIITKTVQQALAEGPWDGVESLYADAFTIDPAGYTFHRGLSDDAKDIYFPNDEPHPWTAYWAGRLPRGLSNDQTEQVFGVFRTLRTPNFNSSGQQINSSGGIVSGPADPRDSYFFKPNPANCAADQIIRWGKRAPVIVNWPAWCDWRDWNDETIPFDDAAKTPRSLSLTGTTGGTLTPGNTYYVRVAAVRGADISSASRATPATAASSIKLAGGQTAFQVNWLLKGDELTPPTPPVDITSYRVYIGTTSGVWLGYFTVSGAAARNRIITTTAGVTAGNPLDQATSGLLINIKRFECGLFFIPPYSLSSALNQICQISCADWQWSGLGTGTYRNDKVRFMSPATRASVFTIDLAQLAPDSFHTNPVDRRNRPNQIIVNFRDRADEFLDHGDPVILSREGLIESEGTTKSATINAGTVYRSQAQRIASFYARVLCDADQEASLKASPKSFHVLPADVVRITNNVPDWNNQEFVVIKKGENVEKNVAQGDRLEMRSYLPTAYSDTDHSPLPSPLPHARYNPLLPPAHVLSVTLAERYIIASDRTLTIILDVNANFASFSNGAQRGRVYYKLSTEAWEDAQVAGFIVPNPSTLKGSLEIRGLEKKTYNVRVVPESELAAADFDTATTATRTVVGKTVNSSWPAALVIDWDRSDSRNPWVQVDWDEVADKDIESYLVYEMVGAVETIKQTALTTYYRRHPRVGETTITFRVRTKDTSKNISTGYATDYITLTPLPAPATLTASFEPNRFTYKCAVVPKAVAYRWTRDITWATFNETKGPQFIETGTADIPRTGTVYCRAIDRWDGLGLVKSQAYTIPLLAAPATLVIRYEPFRLVYQCAVVATAKAYEWAREPTFTNPDKSSGPSFIETDLTIPHSGTIYCRAIDKWDDPGAVRSTAYTIPTLPAPATLTVTQEPMRLVYRCAPVTNAKAYEWARDAGFTNPDRTVGPTFIEADLTIPRTGTIYCRARDAWDDPGATKSTAYSITALPAPTTHTIGFDGVRLTHTCTVVTNAKKYQWADDAAFTVNLITTVGPIYIENKLAGHPRTATNYVRALDAWDDPGTSRSGTYNVPAPPKPRITKVSQGVATVLYEVYSSEAASKTETYLKTTLEQASDVDFTLNFTRKIAAGYDTTITMPKIPGILKTRLRGWFTDAFGNGVVGATYV